MEGRAPVLTCRDCKTCVDGCPECDGPLIAVPCDDAAIERAAVVLCDESDRFVWQTATEPVRECYRELAAQAFRAAGRTGA